MKAFDLHEPTSVAEAVGLLDTLGATGKILAGGSDIVGGIMKDWVTGKGMPLPSALVDITTIPELKGIKPSGNGLSLGCATTLTEVIESADVQKTIPLLSDAAKTIASPLIRNFGTLGGNINQRPRCWFCRGEDGLDEAQGPSGVRLRRGLGGGRVHRGWLRQLVGRSHRAGWRGPGSLPCRCRGERAQGKGRPKHRQTGRGPDSHRGAPNVA